MTTTVEKIAQDAARREWQLAGRDVYSWAAHATRRRADKWGTVAHEDMIADCVAIAYERYAGWRAKHSPGAKITETIRSFLKSAAKTAVSRRFAAASSRKCAECGWKPDHNGHRFMGRDCPNCGAVLPAIPRVRNAEDGTPAEELATFDRTPTDTVELTRVLLALPVELRPVALLLAFSGEGEQPPTCAEIAAAMGCCRQTAHNRLTALRESPVILGLSADRFAKEICGRLHLSVVRGETLAEIGGAA